MPYLFCLVNISRYYLTRKKQMRCLKYVPSVDMWSAAAKNKYRLIIRKTFKWTVFSPSCTVPFKENEIKCAIGFVCCLLIKNCAALSAKVHICDNALLFTFYQRAKPEISERWDVAARVRHLSNSAFILTAFMTRFMSSNFNLIQIYLIFTINSSLYFLVQLINMPLIIFTGP